MNINFHYFTIKVLAIKAGFQENDAQLIASYSQFVDDYDRILPYIMNTSDIPLFARGLTKKVIMDDSLVMFIPATTGLPSESEQPLLMAETFQRYVLAPFHFIPQQPIPKDIDEKFDRSKLRAFPVTIDSDSLLKNMLIEASDAYSKFKQHSELINIGILMHVLADTYAHQLFSGLWGWENYSYIEHSVNNITGDTITDTYWRNFYCQLPSIGHANTGHLPDNSFASFTIKQSIDKTDTTYPYKGTHSRNNTIDFLKPSKEIINYLRENCLGNPPITNSEWNELKYLLSKCFLTSETSVEKLVPHWENYFPDINFKYSTTDLFNSNFNVISLNSTSLSLDEQEQLAKDIFENKMLSNQNIMLKPKSNDFFWYNVYANRIKHTVNPYLDKNK